MTRSAESETNEPGSTTIRSENVIRETTAINNNNETDAVETEMKMKTDTTSDVKTANEINSEDREELNKVESTLVEKEKSDNDIDIVNEDLELPNDVRSKDSVESDDSRTNDALESNNEDNKDGLTAPNCNDIEENKNENLPTTVDENEIEQLNISEGIKHLEDTVKNNLKSDNSKIETHLQVNGEISPINMDINEHAHENHLVSNDNEIESKRVQIKNSLITLISEDPECNVSQEETDDKIPILISADASDDVNKKINGTIVNQDSISNSSDSETIVNSEISQHETNSASIENNEKNVVSQPISVITVQTCETVDSDCSEAYLTPNELNDTPKKIVENINLSTNDRVSTVKDDVSQLNPSLETCSENKIPSKNSLEAIIVEPKINDKSVNEDEIKIDKVMVEENANKAEVNLDKSITNIDTNDNDNVEEHNIIEDHTETQVETKNDSDIINQPNEDPNQIDDRKGMLYSL